MLMAMILAHDAVSFSCSTAVQPMLVNVDDQTIAR